MTLDELTFMLERLAEAGCDTGQLVAAAKAARDWRVERRAFLAVKRALAPVEAAAEPVNTDKESGFMRRTRSDRSESDFSASDAPAAPSPHPDSRKAVARKGLLTTRRLAPCARQVGAALVERFNPTTSRCDASVKTLAGDAGYDLRSARRAIGQLEKAGLISRALQAGRGHTNSYTLQWEALASLAAEVEQAMRVAPNTDSQNRTLRSKPDGRVRQNHTSRSTSNSGGGGQLSLRVFSPIEGGSTDADRRTVTARRHKALVATEMALRGKYRRDERLRTFLAGFHALGAMDQGLIADAEMASTGDGLRTFERLLQDGGRRGGGGTGPPRATGTG